MKKQTFFSRTLITLLFTLSFSGCYKSLPAPAITDPGTCQFTQSGYSLATAQSEMARIINIFNNSQIGNSIISIISSTTYVSTTKSNGTAVDYGFQITFSCDGAAIKTEGNDGFGSSSDANNALNARLSVLNQTDNIKVLEASGTDSSVESCDTCWDTTCDTCTDDDGNTYDCNCTDYSYDCNCGYYDNYGYSITYALVSASNARQAAFIKNYNLFNQTLSVINGGKKIGLTDTLKAATSIIPSSTIEGKMVNQWYSILQKIKTKPKKTKTDLVIKKLLKTGKSCKYKAPKWKTGYPKNK